MTDLRAAAEMALEALERGTTGLAIRAIPVLRQALAQPEQSCSCGEPDALGVIHRKDSPCYVAQNPLDIADRAYFAGKKDGIDEALAQPEQEPVELKNLRDVHAVQGSDGTWNSDQYMCGLFNGLELALSIFENREPVYKELAQPEQEPVAWQNKELPMEFYEYEHLDPMWHHHYRPLYTAPVSKPCAITELLQQKFQSGNNVPVERVTITRSEYEAKLKELNHG